MTAPETLGVAEFLSDRPNEWTTVGLSTPRPYRQRWVPGAFGDLTTLKGVKLYRIVRETWDDTDLDLPARTILEAEAVQG